MKKSDVLQEPVDVGSVTNVDESISSITMYNIVSQLGKHGFSCRSIVNKLKDKKYFDFAHTWIYNTKLHDPNKATRENWNSLV